MNKRFVVSQGHLSVQADFSEPQFRFFLEPAVFYERLFRRLASHGLTASEMKLEWGDQTLGDYHLRCTLLGHGATLRFRVERVEMAFDFPGADEAQAAEVVRGVLEVVATHLPGSTFRAYSADLGVHGLVNGTSAKDFLASFVRPAPQIGPGVGCGCCVVLPGLKMLPRKLEIPSLGCWA